MCKFFLFSHHPLAVLKLKPSNLPKRALDITLDGEKKLSTEDSLSFHHATLGGKMKKVYSCMNSPQTELFLLVKAQ